MTESYFVFKLVSGEEIVAVTEIDESGIEPSFLLKSPFFHALFAVNTYHASQRLLSEVPTSRLSSLKPCFCRTLLNHDTKIRPKVYQIGNNLEASFA